MSDEQLEGKFNSLVVPALGEARAKKIVDLVWKVDEADNVEGLMRAVEMKE